MTPYRLGAGAGALAGAGSFLLALGVPRASFAVTMLVVAMALGALVGGGLGLATQNVRGSRKSRGFIATILFIVTAQAAWSCTMRRAGVSTLLAESDSAWAVVSGRNAFGNLVIGFSHDGQLHRTPVERKGAHSALEEGDSLRIYLAPGSATIRDVWPVGPDVWRTVTVWSLICVLCVALVGGYGARFWAGAGRVQPSGMEGGAGRS